MIEQEGVIHRIDPASPGRTDIFLDIRSSVTRGGNEEGLLGLAFAPNFADNGRFYVYYSAASPRRSVLSRFEVRPDGLADPTSEHVVLEVDQPFRNHNGGMIAFGPDGMLYVGLGDGGSAGDPHRNGQNPGTLLGTILRIATEEPVEGATYAIPADNPFAGQSGARGEVWAYGLRNPWRFSFDRATGDLWVGDVGQNAREEIDIVHPGANYGWNVMEGTTCFRTRSCNDDGLQAPVAEYGHNLGCSVTGGYVYRGQRIPALEGVYLYGDFCSGRIWGLRYDGMDVTAHGRVDRGRRSKFRRLERTPTVRCTCSGSMVGSTRSPERRMRSRQRQCPRQLPRLPALQKSHTRRRPQSTPPPHQRQQRRPLHRLQQPCQRRQWLLGRTGLPRRAGCGLCWGSSGALF